MTEVEGMCTQTNFDHGWILPFFVTSTYNKWTVHTTSTTVVEKKRKDYAFWRQFNEKPSIIPGYPGATVVVALQRPTT